MPLSKQRQGKECMPVSPPDDRAGLAALSGDMALGGLGFAHGAGFIGGTGLPWLAERANFGHCRQLACICINYHITCIECMQREKCMSATLMFSGLHSCTADTCLLAVKVHAHSPLQPASTFLRHSMMCLPLGGVENLACPVGCGPCQVLSAVLWQCGL